MNTSIREAFEKGFRIGVQKGYDVTKEPERKTGKWVLWNEPGCEYAKCTACGEMYDQDDLYIGGNDYPKFCPNCGAEMTKGGENGE